MESVKHVPKYSLAQEKKNELFTKRCEKTLELRNKTWNMVRNGDERM